MQDVAAPACPAAQPPRCTGAFELTIAVAMAAAVACDPRAPGSAAVGGLACFAAAGRVAFVSAVLAGRGCVCCPLGAAPWPRAHREL